MEGFPLLRSLIPFVLVNVPFLFVFYDAVNLNDNIYFASLLALGLSPYAHGAGVIAGYPLAPYYYFSLLVYQVTSFNSLQVALAVKILAIVATYLAGISLYRIARRQRPGTERVLLYAFLFNPVLLLVNDIWIESDIFVILCTFLALEFLWSRPDAEGGARRTLSGAAALIWATVGYYSAVILIPSFLAYAQKKGARPRLAFALVLWGIVFVIPIVAYHLVSNAVPHFIQGAGTSSISILNVILPSSLSHWATVPTGVEIDALAVAAVIAIGVPILFARWSLPLPLGQLVVFGAATSLAFSFVQGDNIVLFLPFLYLSLATIPELRVSYLNLILLQLFFVPELLVVMMMDGPGYVSGFYYWAYYLLHENVFLGQVLGVDVWKIGLALYYAGMAVTIGVLVLIAWRARGHASSAPAEPPRSLSVSARKSRSGLLGLALVFGIAILLLVPVGVGLAVISSGRLVATGGFPAYWTVPANSAVPGAEYILPSPDTYQLMPGNRSVSFPANGSQVLFLRSLSGASFSLKLSAALPKPPELAAGKQLTFFETNAFYASFANIETLTVTDSLVPPSSTANASALSLNTTVLTGPTLVYSIATHGVVQYAVPLGSLADRSWFWGEYTRANGTGSTLLWQMTIDNWTVKASEFDHNFSATGISLTGSRFGLSIPADFAASSWIITGFSVDSSGTAVSVFLNGAHLVIPENLTGALQIQMGNPGLIGPAGGVMSTPASVTAVYASSAGTGLQFSKQVLVALANQSSPVAYLPGMMVNVSFQEAHQAATVGIDTVQDGASATFYSVPASEILLGKSGDIVPAVNLSFDRMEFQGPGGWDSLGVVVIGFGAGIPAVLVTAYYLPEHWWTPRRPRSR